MHAPTLNLPRELAEFHSASDEETRDYGRRLARVLPRPCLLLLSGELGAGKTTLVKGLAEGLGVAREEDVASPSYTLIHEYHDGGASLYHIDLYRLDTPEQVATLGLEDLIGFEMDREAIVAVEWGSKFPSWWAREYLDVSLTAEDDERRLIHACWVAPAEFATGTPRHAS